MKEEEEKRSEGDELLSGRSLLDLSPWLGRGGRVKRSRGRKRERGGDEEFVKS